MGLMTRDFSGKLNLDVAPSRLPAGDYIYAENITRNSQGDGNDGVVANIVGNRLVAYNGYQPNTVNICIGTYADSIRNNVIFFVWNNQGYHNILKYDNVTRTISKILTSITDTANIDILNLQLLYKVNSINVIHRDEDGDLLLWNEAYNRPGQLNIADFIAGIYGTTISDDLIRLSRMPPVDELNPTYDSDSSIITNNLKKKLFQFSVAWGYKNGEVSTISPVSKTALPTDASSVEVESDPGKNNIIKLRVTGGPADYSFVRIFGRQSAGAVWGDWFIVDTLDRDDYSIPPGGTYEYRFLNDGQYIFADQLYMELLFDYTADRCNAQALVNGNVIIQGGILEGYDQILRSNINVQLTSALVETTGNGISPANPTLTPNQYSFGLSYRLDITVGNSVTENCAYYIKFHGDVVSGADFNVNVSYIANSTDDRSDVAQALVTAISAQISGFPSTVSYVAPNIIRITNTQIFGYPYTNIIVSAQAPVFYTGANATWKWNANYRFGIVYVDKYGKTNGVISFVGAETDPTDFSVTTPDFSFNASHANPLTYGNPKIPVINASINHIPPDWAVAYYWVRTPNQTTDSFLQYITAEVQEDANYWYFCVQNLYAFKDDNTGFVPGYTFKSGDRLRVYAALKEIFDPYFIFPTPADYEVLGIVQKDMSGGTTDGTFLKVKKPATSPPNYTSYQTIFIEVYTPLTKSTDTSQVFYGFGESYSIYIDPISGIHYHTGQQQDQTVSQPATFQFRDGDVYYKFRDFYKLDFATGMIDPATVYQAGCMDANYSDYFASAVNSNGTAFVIDRNAKRLYQPTLIRFGQAYQPGTDINGLNRFYPLDFDEYFRDYGAIQAFSIRDKLLRVYQKLRTGRVPIFGQIIKDQTGTDQLVVSDKLLNPIQYYEGQFGIGDHPESIASNNYSDYFIDNIRGVINRLSQDGLKPISILYEINNFAVTELGQRDFKYKTYGVFDSYNNLYILALEATPTSPAKTLVWNEQRNCFESFLPYAPEMMCCLNQLLIMWKDGQLYTHDSDTYNNFFGVQYDSSITAVFNDNRLEKKTFENITELASTVWDMPEITTQLKSYGNTPQSSKLIAQEFGDLEGEFHAVFRSDANSQGGINNGASLKGTYMIAKFRALQPTEFTFLDTVAIEYNPSPKNLKK